MNKSIQHILLFLAIVVGMSTASKAGNPDRQGEAGAYELLLNPWARSAGLHAMNTSFVKGVDGLYLNVAGIARMNGNTEIGLAQGRYLTSTGLKLNSVGLTRRIGKNGTLGVSLSSLDFGDINITTTSQPEGTGGTYSPSFINVGLSYAHMFDKISVGATVRLVSESITDVSATALSLDAGVQYVTGEKDQFKFGVSLKNIGSKMRFNGEGLSFRTTNPEDVLPYELTVDQRSASFELPSQLNIGASYDFLMAKNRLTVLGNFTSNAFSKDEIGAGIEYGFGKLFALRAGYKAEVGKSAAGAPANSVYTGLCGGVSLDVPLRKGTSNTLGIDYAYQTTNPFNGTHNIAIRIGF